MPKSERQKHQRFLIKRMTETVSGGKIRGSEYARDFLNRLAEVLVTDEIAVEHFEAYCEHVAEALTLKEGEQ